MRSISGKQIDARRAQNRQSYHLRVGPKAEGLRRSRVYRPSLLQASETGRGTKVLT